jgi:hypothetical protein
MSTITVGELDTVSEAQRFSAVNQSVRTLQRFDLDPTSNFAPHPEPVMDIHGKPTSSGITEVIRTDAGEITAVNYINPKDSADQYAVQTMKVKDGVMVLPTSNEGQAAELSGRIHSITDGKSTITLEQFDRVLKETHEFYAQHGLTPDIYNSNTTKFRQDGQNFGGHRTIDGKAGVYSRDSGVQEVVVVKGKPGEEIAFQGNSEHVGTQYGRDKIVLVKDGKEWRKLDPEYARQNLRNPDGSAIAWEKVPTVNAAEVAGHGESMAAAANSKTAGEASVHEGTPHGRTTAKAPPEIPASEAAETGTVLGKIGKIAGPVALVAPTVIEAGADGIKAYKDGKGAGGIAGATALGAGKGVVDTFAPGARSGYSDVIGHRHLTVVDRALNALDHVSGTATAVGGAAMAGEAIGVVTLPAEIPTAIGTGIAGLANVGTNLVKAGLKVSGLAGQDQDGGYIYNGIAWAAETAKALVSGGEPVPLGTAPHEVAKPATSSVVQSGSQPKQK